MYFHETLIIVNQQKAKSYQQNKCSNQNKWFAIAQNQQRK